MTKTKIAHILHAVGGVDISVRQICENLSTDSFEIFVIHGLDDISQPYLDSDGNKIKSFSLPIKREISIVNDVKAVKQTITILKDEKPHLIHAHSAKGGVLAKIAGAYLNIPVMHTPQAFSYLSSTGYKRVIYKNIERVLKYCGQNKILASSNSEKIRAEKEIGYKSSNVMVYNNSIRPVNHQPQLSIQKTWPETYVCTVGRPSFQKNIELMVQLVFEVKKEIPEFHLVLMGLGFYSPNTKAIKETIESLNLGKNITLLEWVDRESILSIIGESQFYISTARYEGLPYSIIESLAMGKAVLATDVDGNRDLVISGYNGYLIKSDDIEKFVSKILKLWNDKGKTLKLSKNAHELFTENFDITKTIKDLEIIYQSNAMNQ